MSLGTAATGASLDREAAAAVVTRYAAAAAFAQRNVA